MPCTNSGALGTDASITTYPGATFVFDESWWDTTPSGGRVRVTPESVASQDVGHTYRTDRAATLDSRKRLLEYYDRTLKKKL